jgi:4,5:9,10-diseco-3-hydroxy-5,9,17-trioxoandrosta-1(10),2-diene-4-oate hydrolase
VNAAPVTSSTTITVGTRQLHLEEAGTGAPVLLLHGGGAGASGMSNYSRNVAALSRHFRVLIPDMPGYGQSTKGIDQSDPFGDLAGSLLDLLEQVGVERAHVVGNSLGGAAALRMAMQAPGRVGRLVLMGPGGIGTMRALPTPGLRSLLGYYRGDGPSLAKLGTFIREYLVFDGSAVTDELVRERYEASIDPETMANPPLQRPKNLTVARRMDLLLDARLPLLQNPTLVTWGADDKVNRPSGAIALQKRMQNCDVHLFSRTGHWVQWEQADAFNSLVRSFLSADESSSR